MNQLALAAQGNRMNLKRLVPVLTVALLPYAAHAADASRTLEAESPTTGITGITVNAGVGQLRISPSPDDNVHVQIRLEPKSEHFLWFFHWMTQSTPEAVKQVSLQQQQKNGQLTYSLNYPDHLDDGDVKQNWTLQVPARLSANVEMKVGQVDVNGMNGGVAVNLNVGEITVNAPSGSIRATVNVGQIRASSATTQPGNINLTSTLGDARLYMEGQSVHEHAHRSGLGRSIDVPGKGPDAMKLDVNIGEVSLHIKPEHDIRP